MVRLATLIAAALLTMSACIKWPEPPPDAFSDTETQQSEPLETFLPGLWLIGDEPGFDWWRFGPLGPDGTGEVRIATPAGPDLLGYWDCDAVGRWELKSDATVAVLETGCFVQNPFIIGFGETEDGALPDGALERAEVFVIGDDTSDDFAFRFPDDWCDAEMNCPDPSF